MLNALRIVITSYSIHYTKLYEILRPGYPQGHPGNRVQMFSSTNEVSMPLDTAPTLVACTWPSLKIIISSS